MTEVRTARGKLIHDEDGARLEYLRHYPDPIEDIWSAVTESDRLARWIGTWTGEPKVGGTVDFLMNAEGDDVAPEPVTITECDPPRRLAVEWTVPDQPIWRVELTLSTDGQTTTLLFVHRMSTTDGAEDMGPGWQYYLDRLAASLTGGPMPDFDSYYPALKSAYAPN